MANSELAETRFNIGTTCCLSEIDTQRTRSRNSTDNDAGGSVNRFWLLQPSE